MQISWWDSMVMDLECTVAALICSLSSLVDCPPPHCGFILKMATDLCQNYRSQKSP